MPIQISHPVPDHKQLLIAGWWSTTHHKFQATIISRSRDSELRYIHGYNSPVITNHLHTLPPIATYAPTHSSGISHWQPFSNCNSLKTNDHSPAARLLLGPAHQHLSLIFLSKNQPLLSNQNPYVSEISWINAARLMAGLHAIQGVGQTKDNHAPGISLTRGLEQPVWIWTW